MKKIKNCKDWGDTIVKDEGDPFKIRADFLCKFFEKEENLDKLVESLKGEKYVTITMLWKQTQKMVIKEMRKDD